MLLEKKRLKKKLNKSDYDDLKAQLEKANATIEGWKDYDAIKADVAKYQQEAENAKKEAAAKVQQLEEKLEELNLQWMEAAEALEKF